MGQDWEQEQIISRVDRDVGIRQQKEQSSWLQHLRQTAWGQAESLGAQAVYFLLVHGGKYIQFHKIPELQIAQTPH